MRTWSRPEITSYCFFVWSKSNLLLRYVMWNLFTVGSLQLCNDSTIASLEANQNRPKMKNYVNK